jgi:hypothetical protein
MAFVLIGHSLFGPEMYAFSTITLSVRTCFFILLGRMDYEAIQSVNEYWAPVFCISYIIVMSFVCVNVFLATTAYIYEELRMLHYKSYEKVENENRKRHPSAVDPTKYSVTFWDLLLTVAPIIKDLKNLVRKPKEGSSSTNQQTTRELN